MAERRFERWNQLLETVLKSPAPELRWVEDSDSPLVSRCRFVSGEPRAAGELLWHSAQGRPIQELADNRFRCTMVVELGGFVFWLAPAFVVEFLQKVRARVV
jgi:hypothetical protein